MTPSSLGQPLRPTEPPRRSRFWKEQVERMAAVYADGRNGMGMQYAGGPVTARHIALWYTPGRPETRDLFGTDRPTRRALAAFAAEVTDRMGSAATGGRHVASPSGYDANLAAEFYVLSCLHRLGHAATLTLGNKKAVDIVVAMDAGRALTIDVKGLAGSTGVPVDNVGEGRAGHFLVFVCYHGEIEDPRVEPEVYVVPSLDLANLIYRAPGGRRLVRLSSLRSASTQYEHAWYRLGAEP
jgi:hypothetical protein